MEISDELAKANELLQQNRRRDGVESWRTPEVFKVEPPVDPELPEHVKAYPTILTASLRQDLAAVARVYLLLLAYDQDGNGVIDIGEARELLTDKSSLWRVCGWRRLRQILATGAGVFWDRHTADHLWLRSPARIAQALKCGHLSGNPVKMPIKPLLGGIGDVRAHFYASFDSGRRTDNPISRVALEQATGVPARTQYEYDKRLGRQSRRSIAVTGLLWKPENIQQVASPNRRIFRYVDWTGRLFGRKKTGYVAYRIPDTRERIHESAARGRLRKINKSINVVIKEGRRNAIPVAYHPDAKHAYKAFNSDVATEHYHPAGGGLQPDATRAPKLRGVGVWGVVHEW